jgi:hypothetical protein
MAFGSAERIVVAQARRCHDTPEARATTKGTAAIASFGMLLRDSEYKGNSTFDLVARLADQGVDGSEYRDEFVELVEVARDLKSIRAAR